MKNTSNPHHRIGNIEINRRYRQKQTHYKALTKKNRKITKTRTGNNKKDNINGRQNRNISSNNVIMMKNTEKQEQRHN